MQQAVYAELGIISTIAFVTSSSIMILRWKKLWPLPDGKLSCHKASVNSHSARRNTAVPDLTRYRFRHAHKRWKRLSNGCNTRPSTKRKVVRFHRFETWAISFTPLCLCLSEEAPKAVGSFYIWCLCKGSKISYKGKWKKPVVGSLRKSNNVIIVHGPGPEISRTGTI